MHNGSRVPVTPETTEAHRAALEAAVKAGPLPAAPTGPVLVEFEPRALAWLIDHGVRGARAKAQQKIRIDMTVEDAAALARFLMRAALAGVGV